VCDKFVNIQRHSRSVKLTTACLTLALIMSISEAQAKGKYIEFPEELLDVFKQSTSPNAHRKFKKVSYLMRRDTDSTTKEFRKSQVGVTRSSEGRINFKGELRDNARMKAVHIHTVKNDKAEAPTEVKRGFSMKFLKRKMSKVEKGVEGSTKAKLGLRANDPIGMGGGDGSLEAATKGYISQTTENITEQGSNQNAETRCSVPAGTNRDEAVFIENGHGKAPSIKIKKFSGIMEILFKKGFFSLKDRERNSGNVAKVFEECFTNQNVYQSYYVDNDDSTFDYVQGFQQTLQEIKKANKRNYRLQDLEKYEEAYKKIVDEKTKYYAILADKYFLSQRSSNRQNWYVVIDKNNDDVYYFKKIEEKLPEYGDAMDVVTA